MRKTFKFVFHAEIEEPEKPYPGGGDYTHLNRIEGLLHSMVSVYIPFDARVTLDKVVEKARSDDK